MKRIYPPTPFRTILQGISQPLFFWILPSFFARNYFTWILSFCWRFLFLYLSHFKRKKWMMQACIHCKLLSSITLMIGRMFSLLSVPLPVCDSPIYLAISPSHFHDTRLVLKRERKRDRKFNSRLGNGNEWRNYFRSIEKRLLLIFSRRTVMRGWMVYELGVEVSAKRWREKGKIKRNSNERFGMVGIKLCPWTLYNLNCKWMWTSLSSNDCKCANV